jgi:signal transduction histidine kinase
LVYARLRVAARTVIDVRTEYHRLLPALLTADPYDEHRVPRSTRDWVVDVLMFVIAAGFVPLLWLEERKSGTEYASHFWLVCDFVAGGLSATGVWLRRRWPLGLGLILLPIGLAFQLTGGAGIIATFTVAVHRRFPVVAWFTAATLAFLLVEYAIHPDKTTSYWTNVAFSVIFVFAITAVGMFVRSRRQLLLSLKERAERAEATQQLQVAQAQLHERERIAREMHDVLAHRISLLSLHAGALEFRPDAPPEEIARAAGVIRSSARQALQDLREVIGVLRDGSPAGAPERPQPTIADLPGLVAESRAAGMRVELDDQLGGLTLVPPGIGRSAYRIVQEGLTNARKHAPGAIVRVSVAGTPDDGLSIEVRNPLPVGRSAGGPDLPGSGSGLIGLTERATLANGKLEHGPTRDGDFRLWVWIPWPHE